MNFPNFVLFLIVNPRLFSSKSSNYDTVISIETQMTEKKGPFLKVNGIDSADGIRIAPKTTNNIIQNSDNCQEVEKDSLTQDLPLNDFCERNKTIVVFSIASVSLLVVASLLIVKLL